MESEVRAGWLRPVIMCQLLKETTEEFRKESYDINRVVRNVMQGLKLSGQERETVNPQVLIFAQLLGGSPRYFVELLNEEKISSQTQIITLNSRNWDVASRLFSDFAVLTKIEGREEAHDDPKLHSALLNFINTVAKRIASLYQKLASHVREKMDKLIKTVKQSRMMNNYLLFKIFKELSVSIKSETTETCTAGVFRYCQVEVIEEFYRYTINKFEMVKLFASMDVRDCIFDQPPMLLIASLEKNHLVEILLKEAVSEDGRYAIFVSPQSSHPELKKSLDDYILFLDEDQSLRLLNCKTLRKKWFIIG
jgi:hypothetical protein